VIRPPRRLRHGDELSLVDHLEELRSRLVVAGAAVLAGTIVGYAVHRRVLELLVAALPQRHRQLVTLGVTEPFTTSLKLSIVVGIAIALPIVLWQLWAFFAPAVDPAHERKVLALVATSAALGAAGVAFGYEVLLPRAIHFLTNYDKSHFRHLVQAQPYYTFVVTVLVGVVIIFQTPLVVLGLVSLGVLSSTTLRKHRRYGYAITAAVALALPGPDLVTTFFELMPMWALYEGSIWLAVLFERRRRKVSPSSATLGA